MHRVSRPLSALLTGSLASLFALSITSGYAQNAVDTSPLGDTLDTPVEDAEPAVDPYALVETDPLAAWEALKAQQDPQPSAVTDGVFDPETGQVIYGAGDPVQAPSFLAPDERRQLERQWRGYRVTERMAIDGLAEEIYRTELTSFQRQKMHEDALAYFQNLPAIARSELMTKRRELFSALTPMEQRQWRFSTGPSFLNLAEAQKDIFRAEAILNFRALSGSERQTLISRAEQKLRTQAEARLAARERDLETLRLNSVGANGGATPPPGLSAEEQMRFQLMTPEQQQLYLEQRGLN